MNPMIRCILSLTCHYIVSLLSQQHQDDMSTITKSQPREPRTPPCSQDDQATLHGFKDVSHGSISKVRRSQILPYPGQDA